MIKPNFDKRGIRQFITGFATAVEQVIINNYKYVGESFVRSARLKTAQEGGFNDVTGNLRSSIGFILLKDGVSVYELFEEGSAGTDKGTGVSKGKSFAEEVAANFPKGIILVVVAGMEYAASVESRGKDVITGSSLDIEQQLKDLFNSI